MADQKISELTAITEGNLANDDEFAVVDTSATETKRITVSEMDSRYIQTSNATHTGEVTGSGALTVNPTAISNKSSVTAATDDEVLIGDTSDSGNLKKVTTQSIADLSAVNPTWTTTTLTVNNGGTLTYDTDYNRYYILGKLLFWEFSFTQTAAGSGTTDITIDPPGGVTMLANNCCGAVQTFDMGNNNINQSEIAQVVSNKLIITRQGLSTNVRGGTFAGNNGVLNVSASLVIGIS